MNKYFTLIAVACAGLFISCNKELLIENSSDESTTSPSRMRTITLTAVVEGETKVVYNDDPLNPSSSEKLFSWNKDDEISVLCSDGNLYTFKANSTNATSTFTGTVPEGVTLDARAYYPANPLHASYSYSVPESRDLTSHPSVDMPMIGLKGEGDVYTFEHLCGAFIITIDNIPDGFPTVEVKVVSDAKKISGVFSVFSYDGHYRWNTADGANLSERTIKRKVGVSSNKASIYVPYPGGSTFYAPVTVSVTGYPSEGDPVVLESGKTMSKNSSVARGHIKPIKPLVLSRLGFIDWSDAGIATFAGNNGTDGVDHHYGERIIQWKATSDPYYLYFYYKILKEKIKWNSTNNNYDTSDSKVMVFLNLDNKADTGSTETYYDVPAAGWEARAEFIPWSGTTQGSPLIAAGDNSGSVIYQPIAESTGAKVSQKGSFDSTYAYLEISLPRSVLGDISSTVKARHMMQWGYYTSIESFSVVSAE